MCCRCIEAVSSDQWNSVTLLMCESPGSKKYMACRRRGIVCVPTKWLTACLSEGRKVPTEGFEHEPTVQPTGSQLHSLPTNAHATQASERPQYVSQGTGCNLCCTTSCQCAKQNRSPCCLCTHMQCISEFSRHSCCRWFASATASQGPSRDAGPAGIRRNFDAHAVSTWCIWQRGRKCEVRQLGGAHQLATRQ